MKAKTIDDAFWKIVQMWPRSPTRETLEGILAEVYEAGRPDIADHDAARWQLFERQFGGIKARHDGYVAIPPRNVPAPFDGSNEASFTVEHATKWRFECLYVDLTGSADTIPKFVTHLLAKRRANDADSDGGECD